MDPIVKQFLALAKENPERAIALGHGWVWSRQQLALEAQTRAKELEQCLRENARGSGALVALASLRKPSFLASFLACRIAGLCVLLLDEDTPAEEQQRLAHGLGAWAIWRPTQEREGLPVSSELEVLGGTTCLPKAACLKLTSGSTSDPVSIMTPTESLLADAAALADSMGFNGEDRFLVTVPLSHAYGLSMLASPAWLLGATLIFPMAGGEFQAAEEFAATVLPSVPSWFEAHLARSADLPPLDPSLRLLISAGAPLRSKTALAWEKTHGRAIHVLYGSSECGGICYDRTGTAAERSRVGSPITGVQVDLDESGLISVRSAAVTTGYFPSSPKRRSSIEDGCFRTEDLGEFVDGELALLGRTSEWINVKGRKVNPREIESVLEQMPSVTDVVVLRRELPDGRGEGIRAVIACAPGSIHFPEVLAWCSSRLVSHKIPRSIAFVEQLPRTSRGKLDRAALLSMP